MVWDELTDHLAVVWGAVVALGIVLVLTPAVGSAARPDSQHTCLAEADLKRTTSNPRLRNIPCTNR